MRDGRHEEGVSLLRNALAAARLNETDDPKFEVEALGVLISALFETRAIDAVEELVPRFREAAETQAEKAGGFDFDQLRGFFLAARLHEVLRLQSRTPPLFVGYVGFHGNWSRFVTESGITDG